VKRALLSSLLWAAGLCSCALDSGDASFEVPPPQGFEPVSSALAAHCGSLDCHGRVEQNMIVHGKYGLRIAAEDLPGGDDTTSAEHAANYQSVSLLEPELLARVWREGGVRAERLTLLRKARGAEKHEGNTVFAAGSQGDRCLLSWLEGSVDQAACSEVATPPVSPFAE
jgi:hypothetical protein